MRMMKLLLLVLGIVCLGAVFAEESAVLVLTSENFDATVADAEIILVDFYAPWCGHCKKLEPEYDIAANRLKEQGSKILLGKVDATEHGELAQKYGVQGYPTLKIFRKGSDEPTEYNGPRDADGIIRYMEKQASPACRVLTTAEEVDAFIAKSKTEDVVFVAFFDKDDAEELAAFRAAANALREEFTFAEVTGDLAAKYYKNKVVAYKRFDAEPSVYSGDAKLKDWFNTQALALAGELTAENKKRYEATGLPLVSVYFDVDHEKNVRRTNYYLRRIEQVAKEFAGKVLFAISHSRLLQNPEHKSAGAETVMLQDPASQLNYKYPHATFSVENLKSWAQEYLDKKLKPFIKSEPLPDNSGPVKTAVGENFQELIMDNTDDILIEFYAPWCGHCKSLAPEWEKLANELADVETVTIAKLDATANDWPKDKFAVSGYPTIYFKSGNGEIKKYEGGRTAPDFVRYLEQNANTKFSKSGKSDDGKDEEKKAKKADKKAEKKKAKKEKKEEKKKAKHDEL